MHAGVSSDCFLIICSQNLTIDVTIIWLYESFVTMQNSVCCLCKIPHKSKHKRLHIGLNRNSSPLLL